MKEDILYKLLLLRTPKIGAVKYNELIKQFGSAKNAAESLKNTSVYDSVLREIEQAEKLGIHFISDDDDFYPVNLKEIKNHPPVISVRGNLDTLLKDAVSIVGTRHATVAGMRLISEIAERFASNNYSVVSGMAIGSDSAAHMGALNAVGNGQTIAVLAGGVDYIWPLENESLYHKIIDRGAIISEMPLGFIPKGQNFAQRNRWIAGIGEKLVLGEADLESGSMLTARFALSYGRKLYAIPSHPLDSRAVGPNTLIKNGLAELCMGADDFFHKEKKNDFEKIKEEKIKKDDSLLDKIGTIPVSESVLAEVVKKSVAEIKSELVVLELQGLIRKQDGGYVRL